MSADSQIRNTWPLTPESTTISDAEIWFVKAFAVGEPLLYLVSILGFLVCTVLLVIKTKAPGRFLILASPLSLLLFWIVQKIRNPYFPLALDTSLLEIAFTRFFVAFALFAGVMGYARMVWWLYRNGRAEKASQP